MRRYLLGTLAAGLLFASYQAATPRAQDFLGFTRVFTAQTATGTTTATGALKGTPVAHTIHLVVTGAPSACTYQVQGSANGSVWFNLSTAAITCTATITTFEANKPTRYIRGNLLTLTGGTAPTITLHYVGM